MSTADKYCTVVQLDAAGRHTIKPVPIARRFFQQQFPGLEEAREIPHPPIQRQLVQWMRSPLDPTHQHLAMSCLRCFISHEINRVCGELTAQFGQMGGFTRTELLVRVLDDVDIFTPISLTPSSAASTGYQPLAARILQTFDPGQSQLSTWTKRLVISHPELNRFLQKECGVYLASDWSILNSMTSERLRRLLRGQYLLTPEEIEPWCHLLDGFHLVYRSDRLRHRRSSQARCAPPTPEQLTRIAHYLAEVGLARYGPQRVLWELQTLADKIRRCRSPKLESLEALGPPAVGRSQPPAEDEPLHQEFLQRYRQDFHACLEQAIHQVVSDRLSYHRRRRPPRDQCFLTALHLFHCRGQSMTDIAQAIGLQKQYQVSRLLELKGLRADIRHTLLLALRDRVQTLVREYVDGGDLETLDDSINAALETLIDQSMGTAQARASAAHHPCPTLLTGCLCRYLDTWRSQS